MMGYVAAGCGSLTGVVFGVAAVGKVRGGAAFSAFTETVRRLPMVPVPRAGRVALALVAAEALLGVTSPLVLTRMLARVAVLPAVVVPWCAIALVVLGFHGAVLIARVRRVREPGRRSRAARHARLTRCLVRKVALAAIAAIGVVSGMVTPPGSPDLIGGVLASLAGTAVASLFIYYDTIAEVFVMARTPSSAKATPATVAGEAGQTAPLREAASPLPFRHPTAPPV